MPLPKKNILINLFGLLILIIPSISHSNENDYSILKKHIIEYNKKALENSFLDGTYRGEVGILRVKPDVAISMEIKAFINDEYTEAMRLFEDAETHLEEAKNAMLATEKEQFPGYYVKRIADQFLFYRNNEEQAEERLKQYRSGINVKNDERLDNEKCELIIIKLLDESFKKTKYSLRDGLGYFYNRCEGSLDNDFPLTPENVLFVNYVFKRFIDQAPPESISLFDLDRDNISNPGTKDSDWKRITRKDLDKYISLIDDSLRRTAENIYAVDPLLFVSLIKKESDFEPTAVSYVGAAGLTQIMPRTAMDMGMRNIYLPEYYKRAETLYRKERELQKEAESILFEINEKNSIKFAKKSRDLMQKSLDIRKERENLFFRYKKELLGGKTDDRMHPEKAIEYGLRYLAKMLRDQNGDISLALASYNAGPHRVKEYEGLPPYTETVGFRNRILKYYDEYLDKVGSK